MPTYVVTGSSGGIGLGLVKALAARGDKVYATCRKKESSATGVDAISSVGGDVTIIEGIDVTKDSVGEALKSALAGVTIDVLVHNAGGLNATRELAGMAAMADQKLAAVTSSRMVEAFELNAVGPLRVQQALMPQMAAPGGKIAVISSGMGSIGDNGSGGSASALDPSGPSPLGPSPLAFSSPRSADGSTLTSAVYAYRTSKSAVNSIFKGISCDVKEQVRCDERELRSKALGTSRALRVPFPFAHTFSVSHLSPPPQGIAVTCVNPGMVQSDFGPGAAALKSMGAITIEESVAGV